MNLPGIRTVMKAADEEISKNVHAAIDEARKFAEDIPLKGLSPEDMHAIEQRGLDICKTRLADIEAEISRLQGEAANTRAIINASVAKVEVLAKHLKDTANKAMASAKLSGTSAPASTLPPTFGGLPIGASKTGEGEDEH